MFSLKRHGGLWRGVAGGEKLSLRAGLPGAFTYDAAVRGLTRARGAGVEASELLANAFAASWLVNGGTPSPVFPRWLASPLVEIWSEIAATLAAEPWGELEAEAKQTIATALAALAIDGQGIGPISKVLAALAPDAVPLMPDAALSFAIGAAERVANLDAQTAAASHFTPMMDWFAAAVEGAARPLDAIARATALTPAQALDRLLWFDSAGYMYFKQWYWVHDDAVGGVVKVSAPYEGASRAACIDLRSAKTPPAFAEEARRALEG